jgi:hypothetical protein
MANLPDGLPAARLIAFSSKSSQASCIRTGITDTQTGAKLF